MLELSLPRNPRFLVNTLWLIAVLFFLYYGWPRLYQDLNEAYQNSFWHPVASIPSSDESVGINLQVPRYVSSLVEREVVVTVTNLDASNWVTPTIVIKVDNIPQMGTTILLQPTDRVGLDHYTGSTVFHFDPIPPFGQVTQSAWVRVGARYQEREIDFRLFLNNEPLSSGGISTKASVDLGMTIWQGMVQFLLLPPLANIFLPALALFLSLLYEGWTINPRFGEENDTV